MPAWNDERLERIISALLITGVILSAAVVLLGGACYLARHGRKPRTTASFMPSRMPIAACGECAGVWSHPIAAR